VKIIKLSHQQGWVGYENREPGCVKAAFAHVIYDEMTNNNKQYHYQTSDMDNPH